MNGTINDRYFEWLYSKVAMVRNRNPARSYWELTRVLFSTEYTWFVPNDDNRVEDGKLLRLEYIDEHGDEGVDDLWMDLGCSYLEMLIALGGRLAFESEGSAGQWFWKLMSNLELHTYTDDIFEISIKEEVEEALERVSMRTYAADGDGGLFPLKRPSQDQRDVELWYQMSSYLLEGHGPRLGS